MMTTSIGRRPKPPRLSGDTVTVEVTEPHAVYWQGEQRTGTLTDIPVELAAHWMRHRWVTYTDEDDAGAAAGPPPRSGAGANRDVWAAYAESQGITVEEDWKRDDIIDAVDRASKPG